MNQTQNVSHEHKLILENRSTVKLTGVTKVFSIEPEQVILQTSQGKLKMCGKDLHVSTLDIDKGVIDISGNIDSIGYTVDKEGGFFSMKRMFR